jgi:hypothetical protein
MRVGFSVQLCLNAFKGSDGEEGFGDAGAEAGDDGSGSGDLAVGVFEEGFVEVECHEACLPSCSVSFLVPMVLLLPLPLLL